MTTPRLNSVVRKQRDIGFVWIYSPTPPVVRRWKLCVAVVLWRACLNCSTAISTGWPRRFPKEHHLVQWEDLLHWCPSVSILTRNIPITDWFGVFVIIVQGRRRWLFDEQFQRMILFRQDWWWFSENITDIESASHRRRRGKKTTGKRVEFVQSHRRETAGWKWTARSIVIIDGLRLLITHWNQLQSWMTRPLATDTPTKGESEEREREGMPYSFLIRWDRRTNSINSLSNLADHLYASWVERRERREQARERKEHEERSSSTPGKGDMSIKLSSWYVAHLVKSTQFIDQRDRNILGIYLDENVIGHIGFNWNLERFKSECSIRKSFVHS